MIKKHVALWAALAFGLCLLPQGLYWAIGYLLLSAALFFYEQSTIIAFWSASIFGLMALLMWNSTYVLLAALSALIGAITYRCGSMFKRYMVSTPSTHRTVYVKHQPMDDQGLPQCFKDLLFTAMPADVLEVKRRYRQLAKETHPDVGGNMSDFIKLHKAYEACSRYFN